LLFVKRGRYITNKYCDSRAREQQVVWRILMSISYKSKGKEGGLKGPVRSFLYQTHSIEFQSTGRSPDTCCSCLFPSLSSSSYLPSLDSGFYSSSGMAEGILSSASGEERAEIRQIEVGKMRRGEVERNRNILLL